MCCENINLPLGIEPDEDVKRWMELHNLEVNGKMLKINQPCSKLVNGKCSIYEQRPNNCKNYDCNEIDY